LSRPVEVSDARRPTGLVIGSGRRRFD
jgi:hypothetical protein